MGVTVNLQEFFNDFTMDRKATGLNSAAIK